MQKSKISSSSLLPERLNIGNIINKKLLAASRIFQLLLDEDSSNAKCLALSDAEVVELVAKENSKITKAAVKDLKLPVRFNNRWIGS